LESTALQSIVAQSHLHSDGLQVLQDLTATHRPVHVWQTESWPELLVLCHNVFHSVNPNGIQRKDNYTTHGNSDCITHQKKVREWFFHPAKFCKEITAA